MSLADHYGGSYLQEGWHVVTVSEFDTFTYKSGSPGVVFILKDARGRTAKASFVLLDQCLWNLANFAESCGLTQEEAAAYDPFNNQHHARLANRKLQILVQKGKANAEGKRYSEVVDYALIDAPVVAPLVTPPPPAAPPQTQANPPQEPQPPQVKDADIPF